MIRNTRRQFLQWIGLTGLGAALAAAGCSPSTQETALDSQPPATTIPTPTATLAPESAQEVAPTATPAPAGAVEQAPTVTPAPAEAPASEPVAEPAYLAVMHGADPGTITRAAVDALGGMVRFVAEGDNVIIKPNICVNHSSPEYAATTNPTVLATLTQMCFEAGAKRVRLMDTPYTGDPETAYGSSGIALAVEPLGARMEVMSPIKFADYDIPNGRDIKSWSIYRDIMEADVLINVPIAKQHGSTRLTLGCKNLMGVVARPNMFHNNLHQRIADLNTLVRPHLTVIDAVRILTANGPGGGNLDDVMQTNTVIASHDIITADAYATTLFGLTADAVQYIKVGAEMGVGNKNWEEVALAEATL